MSMTPMALADGDTGPVGEHAGGDIHGRKLLEEQFGGVRNVDLGDLRLVLAGPAFEGLLREVPAPLLVPKHNIVAAR